MCVSELRRSAQHFSLVRFHCENHLRLVRQLDSAIRTGGPLMIVPISGAQGPQWTYPHRGPFHPGDFMRLPTSFPRFLQNPFAIRSLVSHPYRVYKDLPSGSSLHLRVLGAERSSFSPALSGRSYEGLRCGQGSVRVLLSSLALILVRGPVRSSWS